MQINKFFDSIRESGSYEREEEGYGKYVLRDGSCTCCSSERTLTEKELKEIITYLQTSLRTAQKMRKELSQEQQ